MKKRNVLILIVSAAAFWPWLGNPLDYVRWEDGARTSVPVALLFGFPCESRQSDVSIMATGPDCFRFSEEREYSGVWVDKFEGSTFVEGASRLPSEITLDERSVWLSVPSSLYEQGLMPRRDYESECSSFAAYRLQFLGRERIGAAGHFGMWSKEIVVDELLEVEMVAPSTCVGT